MAKHVAISNHFQQVTALF